VRIEPAHATVSHAAVDLVVLSDYLVADPRLIRDLHSQGVPHLAVRVRDGTGLVGPLVIPGVTSCLGNHKGGLTPMHKQQIGTDGNLRIL
jgi:hypothetical protein